MELSCAADGFPSPIYRWTRTTNEGVELVKSTNRQVLSLTNVQVFDSGIYRCTAMNDVSSDFVDILLTVQGELHLHDSMRVVAVTKYTTTVRACARLHFITHDAAGERAKDWGESPCFFIVCVCSISSGCRVFLLCDFIGSSPT